MRAYVDQIESGVAVLLVGDHDTTRITLPVKLLPPGTREGMVLRLELTFDETETRMSHETVEGLLDSLGNDV